MRNKILLYSGLVILFSILILWTISFKLIELEDIKLVFILLATTLILILLGCKDLRDVEDLIKKLRFNLFLVSILMSSLLMTSTFSDQASKDNPVITILKPILIAFIVYLPSINILERLAKMSPKSSVEDLSLLSRREKEVLDEVLLNKTNKEISTCLYIAEATVKKHIQHILKKLECRDRYELIEKYKIND